jgi:hypothetical protein
METGKLTDDYARQDVGETLTGLGVDAARGLSEADVRQENNDPIELPIFRHIEETLHDEDWRGYRQLSFTPFDPVRKRTEAEVEKDGERFVAMKGAAQVLLAMAELPDDEAAEIGRQLHVTPHLSGIHHDVACDSVTIQHEPGSLRRPSLVPADISPQAPLHDASYKLCSFPRVAQGRDGDGGRRKP